MICEIVFSWKNLSCDESDLALKAKEAKLVKEVTCCLWQCFQVYPSCLDITVNSFAMKLWAVHLSCLFVVIPGALGNGIHYCKIYFRHTFLINFPQPGRHDICQNFYATDVLRSQNLRNRKFAGKQQFQHLKEFSFSCSLTFFSSTALTISASNSSEEIFSCSSSALLILSLSSSWQLMATFGNLWQFLANVGN